MPSATLPAVDVWKLEDAKARLSELVRRVHDQGPQAITVRGKPSVVVVDAEAYERLAATGGGKASFVEFMQSLDLSGLNLERERDEGREVAL